MVEFDEIDMGAMVGVTGHPDDRTETLGFDELVELVERFLAGPGASRQGVCRGFAEP
jgi:hypothetical protein